MAEKPEKEGKSEKKEAKPQAAEGGKEQKKGAPKKDERTSIVRLAGKDVNGSLRLDRALDQVKGVGPTMAHSLTFAIETKLNIPRSTTLSMLSEQQIETLENLIKNPAQFGVPIYQHNHRKDMETGKDLHLVSNDLIFATRQDINRDLTIRSWRGFRHQYGQKVRGQRTRSTGRTGATVGVVKKAEAAKMMPAQAGAAQGAAAPAAPKAEAKKEEKPKPAA